MRQFLLSINFRLVRTFLLLAILYYAPRGYAQKFNNNWQQDLKVALENYKNCKQSENNENSCGNYSGEVLKTIYRINDFYSSEKNRYMVANEVANFLQTNDQWQMIGKAYEQQALNKAQELANNKTAVVAVYMKSDQDGHVSIILPGQLNPSGSWGFSVPNSVSFFVNDPNKSYIGKGLSYAFTKSMIKDVVLFARSN